MTSTPRRPDPPSITVRSPGDLLVAVPYLLGFHPTDSVVVVGLAELRLIFAARADLPPPDAAVEAAEYVASVVAGQGPDAATVIGYGPPERVDAVVPAFRAALADRKLGIAEALRVHEGRFWSYLCDNPACCPAKGTTYDPAASPVAAAATFAGQVALADRSALARRVEPVTDGARASMREATIRARARLADLLDDAPGADLLGGRALRAAGERAVVELLARGPAGPPPGDDEVAWLTVLLGHVPVRDLAWRRITAEDWQLSLWADVVRRAEPAVVAPPASLLAFAAWLAGQGALANVALDRALEQDPDYAMAQLLRDALDRGLPPSLLDAGARDEPVPAPKARSRGRSGSRGRRIIG